MVFGYRFTILFFQHEAIFHIQPAPFITCPHAGAHGFFGVEQCAIQRIGLCCQFMGGSVFDHAPFVYDLYALKIQRFADVVRDAEQCCVRPMFPRAGE